MCDDSVERWRLRLSDHSTMHNVMQGVSTADNFWHLDSITIPAITIKAWHEVVYSIRACYRYTAQLSA